MYVHQVTSKKQRISFGKLICGKLMFPNPCGKLWFRDEAKPNARLVNGDYILSVVQQTKGSSTPTVIIHQENVDPNKLLKEVVAYRDVVVGTPSRRQQKPLDQSVISKWEACMAVNNESPRLLETCHFCEKSASDRFDHPRASEVDTQIMHRIYEAHKKGGSTDTEAQANALRHGDLFYFVSEHSWHALRRVELEFSTLGSNIYKIKLNGTEIGFAVFLDEVMRKGPKYGILIEEPTTEHHGEYRNVCCALVVESAQSKPNEDEYGEYDISMKSVLYNKRLKNEVYGATAQPDFDFSRLPSKVFAKLLQYLPWNELVLCRRVSKLWFDVGNTVLASNTKMIDTRRMPFRNLKTEDVERLLPIVAGGLETMDFDSTHCGFVLPTPVPSFGSLRKADISYHHLSYDLFLQFLDESPNLKDLTIEDFPVKESNTTPVRTYNLEELSLFNGDYTDASLMDIADLFPKLVTLEIVSSEIATLSAMSSMIKRLSKLKRFTTIFGEYDFHPRTGVFDASSCSSLTSLFIVGSRYLVTDKFLAKLAKECAGLESLDLSFSEKVTKNGVAALATMDNLKKLRLDDIKGSLSEAITAIAMKGRLEQLCVANCDRLTADCLKACIRYCPALQLLDIRESVAFLTYDEAKEIAETFGQFGRSPRLVIRSDAYAWLRVSYVLECIKMGRYAHKGRLVLDCRDSGLAAFLTPEDDKVYRKGYLLKDAGSDEEEEDDESESEEEDMDDEEVKEKATKKMDEEKVTNEIDEMEDEDNWEDMEDDDE